MKTKIFDNWISAIVILPINVLIIIPAILLYLTNYSFNKPTVIQIIFALISFIIGTILAVWSMLTLKKIGHGTLAPWAPPENFVVAGPYKYVRNPMIIGIFFLLFAEFCITKSLTIFIWFLFFVVLNFFYIHFMEEPQLEKRFGNSYTQYKKNVNAWIPHFQKNK